MKWNREEDTDGCIIFTSDDGKYRAYALTYDESANEACATIQITETLIECFLSDINKEPGNPTALIPFESNEDLYYGFEEYTGLDVDYVRIERKTTPLPIICVANFTKDADAETLPEIYFLCDTGDDKNTEFTVDTIAARIDNLLKSEAYPHVEASGEAIAKQIYARVKAAASAMSGYYAEHNMTVLMACFEFGVSEEGEILNIGEVGTIDSATVAECTENGLEEIDSNEKIADLLGLFADDEENE